MRVTDGLVGHLALAVAGGGILAWLASPLRSGSWVYVDGFVWVSLALAAVLTGGVAGLVEGLVAGRGAARTGLALATVIVLPLLWLTAFFVGRWFGDLTDNPQTPDTLLVPLTGWLLGIVVLHVVSGFTRGRARG